MKVTSYCSFDFHNFPFDHDHKCDLTFGSQLMATWRIKLETPHVMSKIVKRGKYEVKVDTDSKQVPFDIKATSMPSFDVLVDGYNYSYAGITLHFKRNNLGLLVGSFYGPLAAFAILSMFSYFIDIDMVVLLIRLTFIFKLFRYYTLLFFLKVPGRMGMLVTMALIAINVYNSVE